MNMDINKFLISEKLTIEEAMEIIDANGYGVVYVLSYNKLVGVVTDGDIRRYILGNSSIKEGISKVTNYNYRYLSNDIQDINVYMKENKILSVPIVNKEGNLLEIIFSDGNIAKYFKCLELPVVIMAGGKGTRLSPYTNILPKPLIPIGNKTITEHIMERFEQWGCVSFYMILNYKRNLIKAYFQDQDNNQEISFVEEKEFLGTGGGLKLLDDKINQTFFFTNCDILVEADYGLVLEYHYKQENILTMVCVEKKMQVPYGTVQIQEEGFVCGLLEKPQFTFKTNTGFYIIEPAFLKEIPEDEFIHITDVIQICLNKKKKIGCYMVEEKSWLDMGQIDEIEKMKKALNLE